MERDAEGSSSSVVGGVVIVDLRFRREEEEEESPDLLLPSLPALSATDCEGEEEKVEGEEKGSLPFSPLRSDGYKHNAERKQEGECGTQTQPRVRTCTNAYKHMAQHCSVHERDQLRMQLG